MFALWAGLGMGVLMFVMMASYALGFWYGAKLIAEHVINVSASYTPGEILIVFFSILSGGINVSQISPCMKAFAEGQQAAARIFAMIDRKPLIVESDDGKVITDLQGDI
jgi:ATP-binding cassette subfamily B (MDR/TAP) protein 1